MENIKTIEAQMHQDMDELVKAVDEFETELNSRTFTWYSREEKLSKAARAHKRMISWISGAVIAAIAVIVAFKLLGL